MSAIVIPTPSGPVRAHLAIPDATDTTDTTGPSAGVVVIHEVFGLNDEIRAHTDRFARQGYLAVAPDLFSYGPKLRCIRDTFRSLMRREGPAFKVLDAVAGWVAAREACTGRVGVIGYCMGGGFALLAAPRPTFAVASVNYGPVPKDAAELLRGACPIVGSYGGQDRAMRGAQAGWTRLSPRPGWSTTSRSTPVPGMGSSTPTPGRLPCWKRRWGRATGPARRRRRSSGSMTSSPGTCAERQRRGGGPGRTGGRPGAETLGQNWPVLTGFLSQR